MLQEILTHTPLWVWFILLFLVSRGMKASKDRVMSFKSMVILPVFMLLWSLQGIYQHFGMQAAVIVCWSTGCLLGLGLIFVFGNKQAMSLLPDGQLHMRGSWKPMILLLTMFSIKYVENVIVAMKPALKTEIGFVSTTCLIYGLMNGLFLANLLRVIYLTSIKNASTPPQTV
ncbi:DUF6622 family protein [Undibacterium sp. Dicai25W]|uniref:DUF6622 family protein n=1 Tax=Undibacterium sp. Dicai25W TaxID=3413034 RepID=UPI003BF2D219